MHEVTTKTNQRKIMPRASTLPEGLRYLQPFRKKFASRPPEKLNEVPASQSYFLFSVIGLNLIPQQKQRK